MRRVTRIPFFQTIHPGHAGRNLHSMDFHNFIWKLDNHFQWINHHTSYSTIHQGFMPSDQLVFFFQLKFAIIILQQILVSWGWFHICGGEIIFNVSSTSSSMILLSLSSTTSPTSLTSSTLTSSLSSLTSSTLSTRTSLQSSLSPSLLSSLSSSSTSSSSTSSSSSSSSHFCISFFCFLYLVN